MLLYYGIKKILILISIIIIIVIAILVYKKHQTPPSPISPSPSQSAQDPNTVVFVFTQDYQVEQPYYDGMDFPQGTTTTKFRKGETIKGKYVFNGCRDETCPAPNDDEAVRIVVGGQNLNVSKSILTPYKSQ